MADDRVVASVKKYLGVLRAEHGVDTHAAVLFGSYARGEADEWSDIDLVVLAGRFDEGIDGEMSTSSGGLPREPTAASNRYRAASANGTRTSRAPSSRSPVARARSSCLMLPDEAAALVAPWAGRPVPVLPIRQVRQSRGYSGARPIRPESRTRTTRRDSPREGSACPWLPGPVRARMKSSWIVAAGEATATSFTRGYESR